MPAERQGNRNVHVIGGGIVGVCCGLHLLRRGWQVTLIDPKPPGSETSFGNAGVITPGSIVPLANPTIWRALPRYASNRSKAIRYHPGYAAARIGWLGRFLSYATERRARRIAEGLNALIAPSIEAHRALMTEAGALGRLRQTGWLRLYRSDAAFAGGRFERDIFDRYAVPYDVLDAAAIAALEPGLTPIFARAVHFTTAASVDGPGQVTAAYAELLSRNGGNMLQDRIRAIEARESGYRLRLGDRSLDADAVVVALGPWSGDLLRGLGYRIPLAYERGYHRHFGTIDDARLSRPIHDVEGAYVLTPTERGHRLTTGVELADRERRPTPIQLDAVLPDARAAFPLGEPVDPAPWLGSRPSLPDCMPAIGPAPRHRDLWFAFGHGHIGFSTGPVTGRMIAEMMTEGRSAIDAAPFDPGRFS